MTEWKEHDGGPQPEETKGKHITYLMRGEPVTAAVRRVESADELRWRDWPGLQLTSDICRYRILDLSAVEGGGDTPAAEDGSPAFPQGLSAEGPFGGATLRAYIATAAMAALIAKIPLFDREGEHGIKPDEINHPEMADIHQVRLDVAESAANYADALIAALNETKP